MNQSNYAKQLAKDLGPKYHTTTLKLSEDLYDNVKLMASLHRVSASHYMRECLIKGIAEDMVNSQIEFSCSQCGVTSGNLPKGSLCETCYVGHMR